MAAATCHPHRECVARGLCGACYERSRYVPRPRAPRPVAACHPEKPHAALGLCRTCYVREWQKKPHSRARRKAYYAAHAESARTEALEWAKRNPERVLENQRRWHRENRGKSRLLGQRRRERFMVNPGIPPTPEELARVLNLTGGRCWYCGDCAADTMAIDHVEPLSSGGSIGVENLVPACPSCNSSKGAKPVADWLACKADPRFGAARRRHGVSCGG